MASWFNSMPFGDDDGATFIRNAFSEERVMHLDLAPVPGLFGESERADIPTAMLVSNVANTNFFAFSMLKLLLDEFWDNIGNNASLKELIVKKEVGSHLSELDSRYDSNASVKGKRKLKAVGNEGEGSSSAPAKKPHSK